MAFGEKQGVALSVLMSWLHSGGEGEGLQCLDVGGCGGAVHWPGSQWRDMEVRGGVVESHGKVVDGRGEVSELK